MTIERYHADGTKLNLQFLENWRYYPAEQTQLISMHGTLWYYNHHGKPNTLQNNTEVLNNNKTYYLIKSSQTLGLYIDSVSGTSPHRV